jgi:hypothetical protein
MNPGFDSAPQATADGMENAIFNLVITLCRFYEQAEPPEQARRRVALYLERVAAGLHLAADADVNKGKDVPNHDGPS